MVKVKVQQGWLRGEQLDTVQGDGQYYSFKGIPYAEPPLGKLRFKAPRPPLPWDGIRPATEHGSTCPQIDIMSKKIVPGSEDCLYLNVYTPELKPISPLPVMVFIHGGGFKSGSGNVKNYGPDFLVSNGVVLVTMNYRLEVLGFLCLDTEEVPGNAGLKDQVAAMRWVKTNINTFGGDSENITIFGNSAGGMCTALHILSPMSKGLFKRVISMSGVPFNNCSVSYRPQERAFVLGKELGFDTKDPNLLLNFLQEVPVEKIIDIKASLLFFEDNNDDLSQILYFTPVTEKDFGQEHFMAETPLEVMKKGKINDVDIFIGYTNNEVTILIPVLEKSLIKLYNKYKDLMVPRKLLYECTADQILLLSEKINNYYFDGKPLSLDTMKECVTSTSHCFIYDINCFISKLPESNNCRRYVYRFSCVSNRNINGKLGSQYGIQGAAHGDDLMYLFDAKCLKLQKNEKEYELVQFVCKIFTNFAKYGTPTPDSSLGVTWPEYNNATRAYVEISDTLVPGTDPDAEAMHFWKGIYAKVNSEYQME